MPDCLPWHARRPVSGQEKRFPLPWRQRFPEKNMFAFIPCGTRADFTSTAKSSKDQALVVW